MEEKANTTLIRFLFESKYPLASCDPGHYVLLHLDGWKKLAESLPEEDRAEFMTLMAHMQNALKINIQDPGGEESASNLVDVFLVAMEKVIAKVSTNVPLGIFKSPSIGVMEPKVPVMCRPLTAENVTDELILSEDKMAIGVRVTVDKNGKMEPQEENLATKFYRLVLETIGHRCKKCKAMRKSDNYYYCNDPLVVEAR